MYVACLDKILGVRNMKTFFFPFILDKNPPKQYTKPKLHSFLFHIEVIKFTLFFLSGNLWLMIAQCTKFKLIFPLLIK